MSGADDVVKLALKLIAGSEPQKTVKAYKLFRQKEGKLYPLFVDANEEVALGQWLKAKAGEQAASGKVKSKLGELAYRPGWHAGDLPIATHIGARSHKDPKLPPDTRPSEQVWAEVEMADDVDWQKVANERARITKKGTPDPKTAQITDQVPYGGYYRYKTNPNMTGNWLIGGDMRVNRVLTDDEVKAINDAAGVADLPRREGYGPGGWVDDVVKMAGKVISGEGEDAAKAGIRAYQGSPHNFAAERLVRFPEGRTEYIVGQPDVLPDVPEGAEVLQDFPLGRMRMDKIGTGEGAQAYGHGLYAAESEPTAKYYRDALSRDVSYGGQPVAKSHPMDNPEAGAIHSVASRVAEGMAPEEAIAEQAAIWKNYAEQMASFSKGKPELEKLLPERTKSFYEIANTIEQLDPALFKKNPGHMYEVNIAANPEQFLDWDKPLSEQGGVDRFAKLPEFARPLDAEEAENVTGQRLHQRLANKLGEGGASSTLREAGIPGIKYLDAGSRGAGDGTRNYVVFDDKLISIIRKYGIAGASAMLGYNLMEQLDPKQALAASMADQDYQASRPQRSMGGNNSISGALNVARRLNGVE